VALLLLASNNTGKLHEIDSLLSTYPADWCRHLKTVTPADLGIDLDVIENGVTYAENAELKAQAFAAAVRDLIPSPSHGIRLEDEVLVLADDSGLEVDALDGAPGIHSARYAPNPDQFPSGRPGDAIRRGYLLQQLQAHPKPWHARFRCIIALTRSNHPERGVQFVEGFCPGEIIDQERGNNGFGYDPIFYLSEKGCTMAELTTKDKNLLSHRARALLAALPLIEQWFKMASAPSIQ
jgi:XTP/dITP diphosphohydrolase